MDANTNCLATRMLWVVMEVVESDREKKNHETSRGLRFLPGNSASGANALSNQSTSSSERSRV